MMRYAKLLSLASLVLATGFLPHQGRQPVRWALIVGVGDYLHYGREPGGDLNGPPNDARNMHEVLTARWGFAEENVRLLLDLDATRAAIEGSLTEWLPSVVQPGDLVLFYYSGHGSQVWDRNGDEADGLDETICPTDVLRGSSRNDIRDDDIADWLAGLPTRNVTVILDSCHSGTATRAAPFVRTKSLDREPERDLADERPDVETRAGPLGGADDSFGEGVLEIAAAQADQYAIETVFDGVQGRLPHAGGAFTMPLVHHLWQVPLHTSYEEIFELTVQSMKQRNFSQNPRLAEVNGRELLPMFALPGGVVASGPAAALDPSPAPNAPMIASTDEVDASADDVDPSANTVVASAPVVASPDVVGGSTGADAAQPRPVPEGGLPLVAWTGDVVELGGGSAAGVTVGSIYRARDQLLRITRIEPSRAIAEVIAEGTRGVIAVRGSAAATAAEAAVLVAFQPAAAVLRVTTAALPLGMHERLATAVAGTPGIMLQRDSTAISELVIRLEGDGYVVTGVDGTARHVVPQSPDAVGSLTAALRKELNAMAVAALENPSRPFEVYFGFGGAENRFSVGDPMEFRVTSGRDGYLTIVDVDQLGSVNLVFPNEFAGQTAVRAGQPVVLPSPEMGFAFQAAEPLGRGVVRVFVTDQPLNLSAGGAGLTAGQLAAALLEASGGPVLPGSMAIPVSGWATTYVVYDIEG